MMKIVPVLALEDGQVAAKAQVRTFARAQETMLDLIVNAAIPVSQARFIVMHTNAPQLAETALDKLCERLGGAKPLQCEIWEAGPVIAVHGGPGAVGVFVALDA
jgi:fatty acid-binding protein DegV